MQPGQIDVNWEGQDFVASIAKSFTHRDYYGFVELLEQVASSGAKRLVIDFEQLSIIDSDGVGLLLMAFDMVRRRDVSVHVRNARGRVRNVLLNSRLDELFEVA